MSAAYSSALVARRMAALRLSLPCGHPARGSTFLRAISSSSSAGAFVDLCAPTTASSAPGLDLPYSTSQLPTVVLSLGSSPASLPSRMAPVARGPAGFKYATFSSASLSPCSIPRLSFPHSLAVRSFASPPSASTTLGEAAAPVSVHTSSSSPPFTSSSSPSLAPLFSPAPSSFAASSSPTASFSSSATAKAAPAAAAAAAAAAPGTASSVPTAFPSSTFKKTVPSSQGAPARDLSRAPAPAPGAGPAPLIDFNDFQTAFQSHSTGELLRALLILKLCSFGVIASNSEKIVHVLKRGFGKGITGFVFRPLHKHFAGGEHFEDLAPTLDRLQAAGVGAILDYAAEADLDDVTETLAAPPPSNITVPLRDADGVHPLLPGRKLSLQTHLIEEKDLDFNVNVFLESVRAAATREHGFAAIKVTALLNPFVLMHLAEACLKNPSDPLASLSVVDADCVDRCLVRLNNIAEIAAQGRVRLLVDAEQTYFQPAIDWMVRLMQLKFNGSWPNVFNTYQCYLVDTQRRLQQDLDFCTKNKILFAAKLVRGAYMVQERQRAKDMGYADPIQPSIEATHTNYDQCVELVLPHVARGANMMIASHNEHSIARTVAAMQRHKLAKDGGVFFGQLLGMTDHVTFTLGHHGYAVYKYVPYGPVYEVVAYLCRRVQENSSITGGEPIRKARAMLAKELLRRSPLPKMLAF